MEKKKDPVLFNLLFNIIIPALVMMKGQKWFHLSPKSALVISLAFPLIYGLYDFKKKKKWNLLSIIGIFSILVTGGVGLLCLSKKWIAIKEAAIPFILGTFILLSLKTKKPLINVFLYNEQIIDVAKVESKLEEFKNHGAFQRLMSQCTWMLAGSFYLSAILNYILAKIFIQSETGTQAFTEELGRMTAWSYPVIALPCTIVLSLALWRLLSGLKKLTHLPIDDLFSSHIA